MTWQGVPWAIGNGAQIPVEAARALAYLALGSDEGPAGPSDGAVRPLAVPGAGGRIRIGTLGLLNRYVGGEGQAYIVRLPEEDTFEVSNVGGAERTDLVAVVVEDPQYAGQPAPLDVADGPYVHTRVYEGVAADVESLAEVDPEQTGYALARITRAAAATTVETADITDLRVIANPKTRQVTKISTTADQADANLTSGVFTQFPSPAGWDVYVPKWAVKVHLELYASGVRISNDGTDAGDWKGKARLKLGDVETPTTELNPSPPAANRTDTFAYVAAGEVPIPAAMRGTTVQLKAQAVRDSQTSGVQVAEGHGSTVVCKATFYEDVSTDAFTV